MPTQQSLAEDAGKQFGLSTKVGPDCCSQPSTLAAELPLKHPK